MVKLVIVESPAKCKKIEQFLGTQEYKCVASFGHIRDIKDGLKGIDIHNNFKPTFRLLSTKMKYIKPLRQHITSASEVILATDDDREGEAIAWHICQAFHLPVATTKRIIFHEITKSAVKRAIENPTVLDMNKIRAQQARQVLDLLVGFRLSPLLWKHVSATTQSSLSAGRCQTPALRLVYDNQREINRSPGKQIYTTKGYFENLPFKLNHDYEEREKIVKFLKASKTFPHRFHCSNPKKVIKKQPLPFTTSGLQQKASNELHFSPKATMSVAQKLYEGGYITYMRTDSRTYSQEFVKTVKKHILETYDERYVLSNIQSLTLRKKDNKAQEAHEAIRPTDISRQSVPMNAREKRLYGLIWGNTLESCMSAATYFSLRATLTAPDERKYVYTSEEVDFPGWKIVGGYEEHNKIYHHLQTLKGVLSYSKIKSDVGFKDLKKHYTEARLVQLLEKKGIGRPSTFSNLISKIQDRGYVMKEDVAGKVIKCVDYELTGKTLCQMESERTFGAERNKLVIQPVGVLVLEFLLKYFDPLFCYEYTKQMEDNLDLIAKENKIWYTLCETCNGAIDVLSSKIIKKSRETIRINENHIYMIGKYGPVIRCDKDGETSFLSVRKDIDMEILKRGDYTLDMIVDKEQKGRILGKYKEKDVSVRKGKFGKYISYNGKNYSIKHIKKSLGRIELEDVLDVLSGKKPSNPNILRELREDLSVRKGKWGSYLFYKTDKMKKPRFLKLKGCGLNVITCLKGDLLAWVGNEYNI